MEKSIQKTHKERKEKSRGISRRQISKKTQEKIEETQMRKICSYCGKRKNKGSFPKHSMYKDNLDTRCKKCVKKHSRVRNQLHKEAPPRPELCECCKKVPIKWVLDHDHGDDSFRGWICDRCNTGIGKLGDDLQGIVNAMNYFLSRPNR